MDKLTVADISSFESKFLATMKTTYPDVLTTIKAEKEVSDATDAKLKEILTGFVDDFRAAKAAE